MISPTDDFPKCAMLAPLAWLPLYMRNSKPAAKNILIPLFILFTHYTITTENLPCTRHCSRPWEYIRQQDRKSHSFCASYTLLSSHQAFESKDGINIHSRVDGSRLPLSQHPGDLAQIWKNKEKGLRLYKAMNYLTSLNNTFNQTCPTK